MRVWRLMVAVLALAGSMGLCEGVQVPVNPAAAIVAMMQQSAADWNRGDLDAFATAYKRSPDILFIGARVSHGFAQMLANYKAHYPTPAAMGVLSFTRLEVQPLDAQFATATGHFHLERTAAGGNADGYFLLVLEKTADGWKIVRDDSTASPAAGADKASR